MEQDFRKLQSYIEGKKNEEANRFMSELASSLRQELHASLIDAYLLNIFDETYGLLFFVNQTVNQKAFSVAVTEALDIICTLVNTRPRDVTKHTPKIRESCIKTITSSISEAKVKRRALDLLKLVIQNTDFFPSNDPYSPEVIFEKLHMRLDNSKGTVLATCATALGALIKKYPFVIKDHNIFRTFINKLENAIKCSGDDEIAGCFNCVSDILEQYTDFDLKHLYRCVKQLMEKELHFRKTGHRACLALVTKHTELFSEELYVDMWWWKQALSVWLGMKGEDCKAGYAAMDAINQKVSKHYASKNSPGDAALCSKIISGFTDDINNPSLHGFKLRLAIRGLGFFVDAAKMYLSPNEITVIFIDMIHKIEKTYLIDSPDADQLEHLPDYVQTLSNILMQLENLSDYEISVLQQAMILMIKLFPRLSVVHHNLVVHAVLVSLIHLKKCKNEVFNHFLQNIVKQGVIWSCSHSPIAFAEVQKDNVEMTTYRKFLPFWHSLLKKPDFSIAEKTGVDHQVLKHVMEKIFQELMLTLFVLTNKLNLNTQLKDNTYVFTDPERTFEAVKANDFDIFINLVDLYVDLLKDVDKIIFKKCIPMYVSHNIAKANKYPLVSGFYKLLAVGLEICGDVNYFDAPRLENNEDVKACYNSVSIFIQNMIPKIKQHKGDLQIACIHVLLKAPSDLIREVLPNISPIFATLLALGLSNLKLVEVGVSTLEFWYQKIPSEELEPFLKEILPSLDSFLRSKSLGENFDLQQVKTLKTKQALRRRKIITLTEKELFNLQKRIMVFLSNLNNDLCASLVESNDIVEPTTWSKQPHLKINLSYGDINLNIYLDNFVPRIVELALHCSERSVRINACEVLHSIVILILGTSASMNETKAKDFDVLLKKIMYPLLQLGSDLDQTVQEIFRPLVIQLMHWYSSPQQKFSLHTAIIIEALMDGITQSADCAVRDFTCTCVHEFIKWTIKQTTVDSLEQEPINVKIFARKIKHFSMHTDASKRLAAALIFNNIYTILREESFIFNAFWLEMLHCFVLNMSLIDEHDQYGCLNQVQQCLNHLERGFVEKCGNFNRPDKNRRIPLGFEGGKLKDVAEWLLKQTGSINIHCREYCVKLFLRIAPLVEKAKNTVQGYMKAHKPFTGTKWISDLYDHHIRNYQDFENFYPSYENLTKWLMSLLCTLDGHIFILENNIIPDGYNLYTSEFYLALDYFFEKINSSELNTFKTVEKQHFNNLNKDIVKKSVDFIITLLKLNRNNVISSPDLEQFLQKYGWDIFCEFIFERIDLIDDSDHENSIIDLMGGLEKYCPDNKILEFSVTLNGYIASKYKLPTSLKTMATVEQRRLLQGLLILQKSPLSKPLNISMYTKGIVNDIFEKLVECQNDELIAINLHDSVKQYCEFQLEFALENKEEFSRLLQYLCDERYVKYSRTNELIQYGVYIFLNFKQVLIKFILKNWLHFFDYVLPASTPSQTHNFINEILRYIDAHKNNFDDSSVRNIIEGIFARWDLLRQYFDESVDQRIKGLEMLEKISGLLNEHIKANLAASDHVYNWVIKVLGAEENTWSFQYALTYVTHIINVLPLFTGYQEDNRVELEVALNTVQEKYFKDVPPVAKVAVGIAITKSFDAALISKSKILFKFSSVSYALAGLNASSFDVSNTCKVCMSRMNTDEQEELLQRMYELCSTLSEGSPNISYAMARDILINLVRYSAYSAFEQFYVNTIKQILDEINLNNESAKNIIKKTVAYILIKILFLRVDKDKMQNKECPITKAAYSNVKDGKELTRNVTKMASAALKENINDVPADLKEYFRSYMCHCYNALVCIISNTQKNSLFYKMLFSRDVNGENMLWRNLIDTSSDYTFEMDFDKLPTETKALVSIRSTMQAERKRMNQSQSVRYLESQYLFNSTLSEDVQQYDLTHSVVRSQPLINEEGEDLESSMEMVIDIDSVEICSHECMATLCGLMQHMADEITPTPEGIPVLPDWMGIIRSELTSPTAPRNVKLFLVKAIETMQHIFKPYAKEFYNAIIQLILDGHAGTNINYFIADLVSMLISWSEYAHSIEESTAASNLLGFLMFNINSDRTDIMKFHLELLKSFIEPWKDRVTIPRDQILSKLSALRTSKRVDVIIHTCAVLLANKIAPWNANQIKLFVKCLCKTLDAEYLSVYRPCAAVIGMALYHVEVNAEYKIHLNSFVNFIADKLKKFEDSKCLNCLQEIINYYPPIADKFINKFIYKFKGMSNDLKVICLKLFLERIDGLHDDKDFQGLDLNDLIFEYNTIEAQVLGLKIVQQMVPKLPPQKLIVVDNVCKFVSSTNHTCRSVMYDILMTVYDIYSNKNEAEYSDVINKCRDVLLQGLVDNNSEIENKLKAFWLKEKNLPKNLFERFTFILKNMYKPSTEKDFLGYFIYFLLNDLTRSDEFSETLFDYQLSDCVFRNHNISDNWRARHVSLAPMFASTFKSLESEFSMSDDAEPGYLRATQTLMEFEPTIKSAKEEFPDYTSNFLTDADDESKPNVGDGVFKVPYPVPDKSKPRRRRFYRDQSKISRGFAFREVQKSSRAEEQRRDLAKQREQSVRLYRKYTIGDFPDISIKLSDVVIPLQELAKIDTHIARQFYITLFQAILKKSESHGGNEAEFVNETVTAINNIFNNSVQFIPNVMGAFLDVALTYKDKMLFQSETILKLSQCSGLFSTGSLLLEEYLISSDDASALEKKEKGYSNDPQVKCWVKLAELYKELNEWDIVRSIFLEKMNCDETILKAIDAESQGFWKDAQHFYSVVVGEDESLDRRDFYYESYYKCFAELSDWESLSESIKSTVTEGDGAEPWKELWDQDWNQQKLLPWYITAELRNSLEVGQRKQMLLTNLNDAMADEAKYEYIKANFCEEIAFLWLLQNNTDKAMHYLNIYIQNFLSHWSNLNPLLVSLRTNKLINMKNAISIYSFVNKLESINENNIADVISNMCDNWPKFFKENVSSIISSETKTLYRKQFVSILENKLSSELAGSDFGSTFERLSDAKFDLDMNLAELAIKLRNFHVAKKYLMKHRDYINNEINSVKHVTCNLAYSKLLYVKALHMPQPEEQLTFFMEAWTSADRCLQHDLLQSDKTFLLSTQMLVFNLTQSIRNSSDVDISQLSNIATLCCGTEINGAGDIGKYGFLKLQQTLDGMNGGEHKQEIRKLMGKAYLQLAYFAYNDRESYTSELICLILKAMYFGSSEARQIFPCLLSIDNLGTEYKDIFLEHTKALPEWMFIEWIPQLLANMNSQYVFAIQDIVLRIARIYPQAIMYAYRLSKEKYSIEDDEVGRCCEKVITELDELLLNDPLVDKLLHALSSVSSATNILSYYLKRLVKACNENSQKRFQDALDTIKAVKENASNYSDIESMHGAVFKTLSTYLDKLLKISTYKKFDPVKIRNSLRVINDDIEKLRKEKSKYKNRLSYYSPWLEHFSERELNFDLEIPGQYRGDRKPLLRYHVKISGFSSEVVEFRSLRRPIKLTFIGSDAKEYPYVVKFGEDLRQDQRVEQMFVLINTMLKNDAVCHEKRLKIRSYQVVPLTSTLGIIEYVGNTKSLSEFVRESLAQSETMFNEAVQDFVKKYLCSSASELCKKGEKEIYDRALAKQTCDKTIAVYRGLVNCISWDILRKAIWNVSVSPESFIALRHKFITTHAVNCISNWILGIGDRHLSNSLVSLDSGEIIDIDFGHAFGSSVQLLPVPELVPFRLTPHILNLMQPFNEHGLIKETMVHIMRSLRRNAPSLLATMSVFIKEPSVEWLEFMSTSDNYGHARWCPETKINHAKRKLEGANPAVIMIEELRARTIDKSPIIEKYVSHVRGNQRDNIRARKDDSSLSVEDQVKCLLDHAIDYNLLGRMYAGWEAWM